MTIGAARAADLRPSPVYTKAPAAAAFNWTGFYIGGNVGGGWHADPTVTFAPNDVFSAGVRAGGPISFGTSGAVGGIQVGYNWQLDHGWLLGVESDFQFSSIAGNGTSNFLSPAIGGLGNTVQQMADEHVQWFGTVRARAGYLATHNLLLYGTGGFAYGKVAESASFLNPGTHGVFIAGVGNCPSASTCYSGTSTPILAGWTAGAGLELALTDHWTTKAEYLYVSLGGNSFAESNLPTALVPAPTASISAHFGDTDFHVVRGGVNYRF